MDKWMDGPRNGQINELVHFQNEAVGRWTNWSIFKWSNGQVNRQASPAACTPRAPRSRPGTPSSRRPAAAAQTWCARRRSPTAHRRHWAPRCRVQPARPPGCPAAPARPGGALAARCRTTGHAASTRHGAPRPRAFERPCATPCRARASWALPGSGRERGGGRKGSESAAWVVSRWGTEDGWGSCAPTRHAALRSCQSGNA
eukprot:364669-Chlamydomonas_euryale.AAC.4